MSPRMRPPVLNLASVRSTEPVPNYREKIEEIYAVGAPLGCGASGSVVFAKRRSDGLEVALKQSHGSDEALSSSVMAMVQHGSGGPIDTFDGDRRGVYATYDTCSDSDLFSSTVSTPDHDPKLCVDDSDNSDDGDGCERIDNIIAMCHILLEPYGKNDVPADPVFDFKSMDGLVCPPSPTYPDMPNDSYKIEPITYLSPLDTFLNSMDGPVCPPLTYPGVPSDYADEPIPHAEPLSFNPNATTFVLQPEHMPPCPPFSFGPSYPLYRGGLLAHGSHNSIESDVSDFDYPDDYWSESDFEDVHSYSEQLEIANQMDMLRNMFRLPGAADGTQPTL